jgi:hypothetical protein
MKYIKLFEAKSQQEMKQQFKEEFRDFCEQHLAYLLDDDNVSLICTNHSHFNGTYVKVSFEKPVHWNHIKDHIIPFYHYLQKKYYLKDSLLELKSLDTDGEEESKYYDMNDDKFKDWLGRSLPYEYSMNKILIYNIKVYLDTKRVYGKFDLERYKK